MVLVAATLLNMDPGLLSLAIPLGHFSIYPRLPFYSPCVFGCLCFVHALGIEHQNMAPNLFSVYLLVTSVCKLAVTVMFQILIIIMFLPMCYFLACCFYFDH